MHRWTAVAVCALALAALAPTAATASQLIDRNPRHVRLAVNGSGMAVLTYTAGGRRHRVAAWGAINALPPTSGRRQVEFRLDYSGRAAGKRFRNRCLPYDGPPLAWLVAACKAPDGSYWAVQAWRRMLPNHGVQPRDSQAARELRLSHWSGPLAQLEVGTDWARRRYDHLFGRLTYAGAPVYGYRVTRTGAPLDGYGRNIYVDTFGSGYGRGWRREFSFLTQQRTGAFCYAFYPAAGRPSGMGTRYRATVIGPGVTPDVTWEGAAPGPYSRELDSVQNSRIRALGSPRCRPN